MTCNAPVAPVDVTRSSAAVWPGAVVYHCCCNCGLEEDKIQQLARNFFLSIKALIFVLELFGLIDWECWLEGWLWIDCIEWWLCWECSDCIDWSDCLEWPECWEAADWKEPELDIEPVSDNVAPIPREDPEGCLECWPIVSLPPVGAGGGNNMPDSPAMSDAPELNIRMCNQR